MATVWRAGDPTLQATHAFRKVYKKVERLELNVPQHLRSTRPSQPSSSPTNPINQPTKAIMDSFTTISFTSKAPATVKVPTDAEDGSGQGGGTYCVVFAKDIPTDSEDGSGQGGGTYCTIA